jgi:rod shape-determining protein MreB and related proteins
MLGKKLGVDLGAGSVRIVVRGEGQVLGEPSLVARHRAGGYAGIGLAAAGMAGDPELELVRPLAAGAVVDREALSVLLQQAVNRSAGRQRIFRPDVVLAVSPALNDNDRLFVLEVCARLGTRTSYLIDTPVAAAIGAGHSLSTGRGHLVADLGAGSIDVACLASEGTVAGRSLREAGDALRTAVQGRIAERHQALVSIATAEDVVASLAYVGSHEERRMTLHTEIDGLEATVSVASTDFADLVDEHAVRIAAAVDQVVAEIPPPLRDDVAVEGLTLCGGGARLEGLDRFLGAQSGLPTRVARDAQTCTIRGTGIAVENLDVLKRSFMYIR